MVSKTNKKEKIAKTTTDDAPFVFVILLAYVPGTLTNGNPNEVNE